MLQSEQKISLNGYWDFMPFYDRESVFELPASLKYEEEKVIVPSTWRGFSSDSDKIDKYDFYPMNVFDYPKEWSRAMCGILHRSFTYKKHDNERVFIKFDAVGQETHVILNGEKIAVWDEGYLPLEIEITDKVKDENELYVLCSTWKKVKIPSGAEKSTALVGSWFGYLMRGIWQDCMLITRPSVYISDCEIVPSVRREKIDINISVDGSTEELEATAEIKDKDGKTVKTVTACGKGEITLSDSWKDAIFWDCENPYLYTAEIRLKKDGNVLYTKAVRFGFREFWAEGQNFILNGVHVNLRGDSWHFQGAGQQTKEYALNWCRLCKEHGANSIRFHAEPHPEYYLDAADETGILIVDETAIYGSGKSMDAAHPEYIENCRKHIKRFVKRDKNHPSVVIWSLQNEMRWVDGRDEYKKHVPELIEIFHKNDPQKRLVSLDGDNRLIDKEHTEVASLHYNIDGTINQWDRLHPLTIGEHGGLWYICPQNSSMYLGLKTYQDSDYCADGISVKEQIFMEYARLQKVSGISSFNFAHYFALPMPDHDIPYENNGDVTDFGVHPKLIKKYSLTINNGRLKDYPYYMPNSTCKYATEGMRPVTIILSEYNHSFYDDEDITKTLNVFNDTLSDRDVKVDVNVTYNGENIFSTDFSFRGKAGEFYSKKITFAPPMVSKRESIRFSAAIYHDKQHIYTYEKDFSVYPHSLKTEPVTQNKAYWYGNDCDMKKVGALVPNLIKIESFSELGTDTKLLIVGSNIKTPSKSEDDALRKYFNDGGSVLLFEQFSYAPGEMTVIKKDFLRAQASDYSHPILKGLSDDDLTYWNEAVFEEGPDPFIHSAFEKPVSGDYKVILESSYGDFNDGGDLWSPLLEYRHKNASVIGCQLDVMKMFNKTPQAAVLARNMIEYMTKEMQTKNNLTAAAVTDKHKKFLDTLGVSYEEYENGKDYDLIIASADCADKLKGEKGRIFVLPEDAKDGEKLSCTLGINAKTWERPTYELKADYNFDEMKTVSIVDMFGYDKPGMSPRETKNRPIAFDAVKCEGAQTLMESIEGNIWYDLFINGWMAELQKRALVEFNKINAQASEAYYVKKDNVYICRFAAEPEYDKSVRMYTNLLSNLGCEFKENKIEYVKAEAKNAIEMIMSLPYLSYQDYDRALEYYSDPEFSLNNLGEGLYGWMKKWERDPVDGFMKTNNTKNKTLFVTTFVHNLNRPFETESPAEREYKLDLISNSPYKLYINGEQISGDTVTLKSGINRFFMLVNVGDEDFTFRAVFKNPDGTCADNLLYRVTTDEVDPK